MLGVLQALGDLDGNLRLHHQTAGVGIDQQRECSTMASFDC